MSTAHLRLLKSSITSGKHITITGSKSESNRALILRALFSNIHLHNLSNSDDTRLLQKALDSNSSVVDIHHAGTAMRFLTAYYAAFPGKDIEITGSHRMKERPIKVLVEALTAIGAEITYQGEQGFPPLKIKGKSIDAQTVELAANVSSQYISALLLVAPSLKNGLEIRLIGNITSRPYIEMTLALLNRIGVTTQFTGNTISVKPLKLISEEKTITVESDWSSASYFYGLMALAPVGTEVHLNHYFKDSLQGDVVLQDIYTAFGVETTFTDEGIRLKKTQEPENSQVEIDLSNAPDIAQTIAVTCFGLKMSCSLTGLHTLKIKETDRLEALKAELTKLGANIEVTNNSLKLYPSEGIVENVLVNTYHDHRMAMAFAPLALRTSLQIEDPMVVSKSYPDFWSDLATLGIEMK